MGPVHISGSVLPELIERPGRISLQFDSFGAGPVGSVEQLEVGLPFRSPPRAALSDLTRLRPILGNLLSAQVRVDGEALRDWLAARCVGRLQRLELELTPQGCLVWGALAGPKPGSAAWFSTRIEARQEEERLLFELHEPRIYGPADEPAADLLLAGLSVLLDGIATPEVERGAALAITPLVPILRSTLAPEGWKLPLRAKVRLDEWRWGFGAVACSFSKVDDPEPILPIPRELSARLRRAELLAHRGELRKAIPMWLSELKAKEEVDWCTDRIAQAVAAQPELFTEPERILDSLFRVRPEFPAGLLAAAVLALRREDAAAAAERFESLARRDGELPVERLLALTAAGQALLGIDAARANVYFQEALAIRREHEPALAGLAALPVQGDADQSILRTRRLLAVEDRPSEAAALHLALGKLMLGQGRDHAAARRHFELALALDPRQAEAARGLASALVARGGEDRGLALLAYLAERHLADGLINEAVSALLRRGELASALPGMADVARASYERVLQLAPGHPDAAQHLSALDTPEIPLPPDEEDEKARKRKEGLVTQVVRLSLATEDGGTTPRQRGEMESALSEVESWPAFLQRLSYRAEGVTDVDLKVRVLLQGAEICETRLDDPMQAEEWYSQVLDLVPDDTTALDAMIRLLGRREAWPALVEFLLLRAGKARDTSHWAELLFECGEILALRMGEHTRAVAVLEAILQSVPDHRDGAMLLARSLEELGRADEALQILTDLEEQSEGPALLELLERKAQLLVGTLERPKAGIQTLVRILKLDPSHDGALTTLDELYQERGNPKMELAVVERRLANLFQKGAGSEEERILRSNLFLRRGKLRSVVRGDAEAEGVRKDYEMALREWRGNAEAAELLAGIYRSQGNERRLAQVLPLLIEAMLPGPARKELESELNGLRAATPFA